MPVRRIPLQLLTFVVAGALVWLLRRPMLSDQIQPAASAGQGSATFTPAHRTALDAMRDFLGRRPAPVQPIAYTHKVHLAAGLQCLNCHTGADSGPDAQLPGVRFCMACHQIIAADRPEIKKLAAYLERGEDIPWQRVVRADGSLAKGTRQRALLLAEGVPMRGDRVDLSEARLPPEL